MTKYILNSGGAAKHPPKDKAFIDEILKGLEGEVNVLYCFFAQPKEAWEEKFESYKKNFEDLYDGKCELYFELALPEEFQDQVKRNDVIFILGGDNNSLKKLLVKVNLQKIWDGKVVAGSSAGSSIISASSWSCNKRKCMDGFGIVPVKFLPHYKSEEGNDDPRGPVDWQKAYDELSEYGDKSLPIHALEEGDYVVIEK